MDHIVFDYAKFKGRIKEKCGSQKAFANMLGCTQSTLVSKLSSKTSFSQREILKSSAILDISLDQISVYFFTKKVQ